MSKEEKQAFKDKFKTVKKAKRMDATKDRAAENRKLYPEESELTRRLEKLEQKRQKPDEENFDAEEEEEDEDFEEWKFMDDPLLNMMRRGLL